MYCTPKLEKAVIDRLARLRLFGEEDESGVSGDASVALAPKRTVTAAIGCARVASSSKGAAFGNPKLLWGKTRKKRKNKRYGAF